MSARGPRRKPSGGCSALTIFTCIVSLAAGFLLASFAQISLYKNGGVPAVVNEVAALSVDTSTTGGPTGGRDINTFRTIPLSADVSAVSAHGGDGRRLMYMAAVFGREQLTFLQKSLDCMLDICNAGWNVRLVCYCYFSISIIAHYSIVMISMHII
jgi:hypothetical protein